ncbi:MAG: hydantoinase/oxoprolinase family protein [Steroidobacteraceae bacterium]|nr:hydantoinase/oxoprolinase family protein [Steroidobacteraceae bacterium]
MGYRIGVDTGGTFTDVVVTAPDGRLVQGKASTTPDNVANGVLAAIGAAGERIGMSVRELLGQTDYIVYGTTHATNAIVEAKTARTALLVTAGHPDVLTFREGTKSNPFDFKTEYPAPYVPRSLTLEVEERVDAEGGVLVPLDEARLERVIDQIETLRVDAVAVCLLWAMVNPAHERRIGERLRQRLPQIAVSLSHEVAPTIREYRRASTTAIDASIKRLMQAHFEDLRTNLAPQGFGGDLLIATSMGGVMRAQDVAERPVVTVRSGPSMAPVAGRAYAAELGETNAIVCDTGGTTFEVSVLRDGRITSTRETWLGHRDTGHVVAVSSVDTRSIGAGGGSIAWIDAGGMLRVGPESAGAVPGPACYGRGGKQPTVTDAAALLGYLRPEHFLGGKMSLDLDAARAVVAPLAAALGNSVEAAAHAILSVAHFNMVSAIEDITVREGLDPRESILIAGGGAGGIAAAHIAASLGCRRVLVPPTAGALSAAGTQLCDIVLEFSSSAFANLARFDFDGVNTALGALEAQAEHAKARLRSRGLENFDVALFVEARYAHQVWELETPLPVRSFTGPEDVARLAEAFHLTHERVYGFSDGSQVIECPYWKLRLSALITKPSISLASESRTGTASHVPAHFGPLGWLDVPLVRDPGPEFADLAGPAIIAEPYTTIVVPPAWTARRTSNGAYVLEAA